jgi:hypothetical protein
MYARCGLTQEPRSTSAPHSVLERGDRRRGIHVAPRRRPEGRRHGRDRTHPRPRACGRAVRDTYAGALPHPGRTAAGRNGGCCGVGDGAAVAARVGACDGAELLHASVVSMTEPCPAVAPDEVSTTQGSPDCGKLTVRAQRRRRRDRLDHHRRLSVGSEGRRHGEAAQGAGRGDSIDGLQDGL